MYNPIITYIDTNKVKAIGTKAYREIIIMLNPSLPDEDVVIKEICDMLLKGNNTIVIL